LRVLSSSHMLRHTRDLSRGESAGKDSRLSRIRLECAGPAGRGRHVCGKKLRDCKFHTRKFKPSNPRRGHVVRCERTFDPARTQQTRFNGAHARLSDLSRSLLLPTLGTPSGAARAAEINVNS